MKDKIKYGSELLDIEIPEGVDLKIMLPKEQEGSGLTEGEIIEEALMHPIGSGFLSDEIKAGDKVCILTNDITRLTRSHIYIPILVNKLNQCGIPDEDITILFANGMHSNMSQEQMIQLITEEIYHRVHVEQHDCIKSPCELVGTTSFGHEVWANKIAMSADKLILTGGILVHHMAGFGGGRKDIIPGCARKDTILSNHKMVVSPNAQAGVLENNPVHEDFMEACAFTNPAYLLNVLCDDHGKICDAVAGHWRDAYMNGTERAKKLYLYPINERPDVVIASAGGFPKDIDLRQSKKGFYNASRAVKPGGTVICMAECKEGCSKEIDDPFEEWLDKYRTLEAVKEEIERNVNMGGLNCYKVREVQSHCRLILITSLDRERMAGVGVECYPKEELNQVIRQVLDSYEKPKVLYMPQAGLTLPYYQE
ncbi:MAG: nickel-dependent lactate racemase [Lachnospiraceae bacterium]|nr:nickel-dependent lactate racemase [Lachnospiraceae bacterium]